MSSIVLPDDAVSLVEKHKTIHMFQKSRVPIASPTTLIALKALACENLLSAADVKQQQKHKKHVEDIMRLLLILKPGDEIFIEGTVLDAKRKLIENANNRFTKNRIESAFRTEYQTAEEQDLKQRIRSLSYKNFVELLERYVKSSTTA